MAVRQTRASRHAAGITIELDDADVKAVLRDLRGMPREMQRAQRAAVKKTLTTARAHLARKVGGGARSITTLKSKEVKNRMRIKRNPTNAAPRGVIAISDRKISLWKYGGSMADMRGFQSQKGVPVKSRKPRKGASFKVYKSGKRQRRKGLVATFGKNNRQAMLIQRNLLSTNSGDNAKPPRDYRKVYGPSVWQVMKERKVVKPSLAEIRAILKKNLESQVDRFLQRKKNA